MKIEPQAVSSSGDSSGLLMALSDRSSDRLRRLLTAYVFAGMAGRLVKSWVERTRTSMSYLVSVPGDDDLYDDVHRWIVDQVAPNRRKAEVARTRRSNELPSRRARPGSSRLRSSCSTTARASRRSRSRGTGSASTSSAPEPSA